MKIFIFKFCPSLVQYDSYAMHGQFLKSLQRLEKHENTHTVENSVFSAYIDRSKYRLTYTCLFSMTECYFGSHLSTACAAKQCRGGWGGSAINPDYSPIFNTSFVILLMDMCLYSLVSPSLNCQPL